MATTNAPLERAITDRIMAYLRTLAPDGWFIKIHGGIFQLAGVPDVLGCYRGSFVAFEVKRPGTGRVTRLQAAVLGMIRAAGGNACVVWSADEVRAVMEELAHALSGRD